MACGDARCYRPGQRIHIKARPRGAAVLREWNQPAACQQQNPCEVTVTKADEPRVAATFEVPQAVVKLDVVGCGCIEMSPMHAAPFCVGSYQEAAPQGSALTLKVARGTDPEACQFLAWDPRGACPTQTASSAACGGARCST